MADFQDFGLKSARYNAVLPTLSDGQTQELQVDANGKLIVAADLSVILDFLGLNGASDSSNILVAGTENGTGTGIAHALRVTSNGSVVINDGGSSITVDATALDIRSLTHVSDSVKIGDGTDTLAVNTDGSINAVVSSTDLDIRNLNATQDNVGISDGTNSVAVNTDGSINSKEVLEGTEAYSIADAELGNADGLISATSQTWTDACSVSVGAGEYLDIYGWQFSCDTNAAARIITHDGATTPTIKIYKVSQNSSAIPSVPEHWGKDGRIEIAGAAGLTVKVQVYPKDKNALVTGSLHARKK